MALYSRSHQFANFPQLIMPGRDPGIFFASDEEDGRVEHVEHGHDEIWGLSRWHR